MRLVEGVGVNDADYTVFPTVNGVRTICPFYRAWKGMLARAYSPATHKKEPSYTDCTVCEEWLRFLAFKEWMEAQDWEGNQLDKDLLYPENKVYSPATCLWVSAQVNSFLTDAKAKRGDYPLGVSMHPRSRRYRARCRNLGNGEIFLGEYDCPNEAHLAWKECKKELAIKLASVQNDARVAAALVARYT